MARKNDPTIDDHIDALHPAPNTMPSMAPARDIQRRIMNEGKALPPMQNPKPKTVVNWNPYSAMQTINKNIRRK